MKRIFVDTNVIIDVLMQREGFLASAKDFEDALQYFCAMSNQCDVIVTRNKKDFQFSSIDVLTPEELF